MPENVQDLTQQFNRRSTDQFPHVQILLEIKSDVQSIKTELVEFKKDVNKAFPKDEDGQPDYIGHRKYHEKEIKQDDKLGEYKTDFVKKLLQWAGIGFIGFILISVLDFIRKGGGV